MQQEERDNAETFVVDRIEGAVAVLIDSHDHQTDVPKRSLPAACRKEGVVLRVPRQLDGTHDWAHARRDKEEEKRRQAENTARLKRLESRDHGGDVTL